MQRNGGFLGCLFTSVFLLASVRPAHAADAPGPTAVVHIHSKRKVSLETPSCDSSGEWIAVCESPCDVELPLDRDYRIGGKGVRASDTFRILVRPGGRAVLTVDAGSKDAAALGTAGLVGGIVLTLLGLGEAGIASLITNEDCPQLPQVDRPACEALERREREQATRPGLLAAGAGVVLAIAGGIAMGANGTDVKAGAPKTSAWTRTPEYARRAWSAPEPKVGGSVFTLRF